MKNSISKQNFSVIILEVYPNSPADTAGLKEGDRFITMNDQVIDSTDKLLETISSNLGKEVLVVMERNGRKFITKITPSGSPPEEGAIGIIMIEESSKSKFRGALDRLLIFAFIILLLFVIAFVFMFLAGGFPL